MKSSITKGFTLVEILVALAIFGFVITIGTGALVTLSNTNHSAQLSRKTIDNVDYIMDDIVRELRLGKNYHCIDESNTNEDNEKDPEDCTNGSSKIAFTNILTGDLVRYYTAPVSSPTGNKTAVMKEVIGINALTPTQLSALNIDVKKIKFYVSGSSPTDYKASQVLITLQAELKKGSRFSSLVNIQTTVAQRAIDN